MKPSHALLYFAMLFLLSPALAQDTICKRDNYCFPAKIIFVENGSVQFRRTNDANAIIERISVAQLKKIKYENGEEVYFNKRKSVTAVGLSFYYAVSPARSYDIDKYSSAGSVSFFGTGVLLSLLYHGKVLGIAVSSGYGHKSINREEQYQYTTAQNAFYNNSSSIDAVSIPLYFCPRINLKSGKVIPFFDFTVGTEFYQSGNYESNPTIRNPFIWKTAFGVQGIQFTNWLFELKAGFGIRSDFYDNKNSEYMVGSFDFSFFRILRSPTAH